MWPYAAPGETEKRSLSEDDEAAVIFAYSQPVPPGAARCGPASVLGGRVASGGRGALSLLAVGLLWLGVRRPRRTRRAGLLVALSLGLAAGPHALGRAEADSDRVTAAEADDDGHVRHAGHAADAERLRQLTGDPARLRIGRAERVSVAWRGERLVSTYALRDDAGQVLRFEVQGGVLDGVVQRLAEVTLPREGERLAVAPDTGRWAHATDGRLHGGALGHGPAIAWPGE